uniref:Uncharacterized protein n=1 Tax=Ditylenchus dipsaci TaxID=166011 RepID=A0A915CXF8_9BILA
MLRFTLKIFFLVSLLIFSNAEPQQFGGSYAPQQAAQQVAQPNQLPAYNPQQVPQSSQLPAYNAQQSQITNYGPQQQLQTGNYGQQQPQNQPLPSSFGQQQQFQGQQQRPLPQAPTSAFQNTLFPAPTTPPSVFNMWDQPAPPIPTKPPPAVEPFYTFKEGTLPTYCGFGVNPVPVYTDPSKKCVPYHPGCGILFTCILNV